MKSVRKQIESNVRAYHGSIPDEVPGRQLSKQQLQDLWNEKIVTMEIVELLRYAHPSDRAELAYKAMEEGLITKAEASEFTKTVRFTEK